MIRPVTLVMLLKRLWARWLALWPDGNYTYAGRDGRWEGANKYVWQHKMLERKRKRYPRR